MPTNTIPKASKKYKQLTHDDRERISVLLAQGMSATQLAAKMERSPSTITRELKRNSAPVNNCAYSPSRAQIRMKERQKKARSHGHLQNPEVRHYVLDKLKQDWSPEQIAGRISIEKPGLKTNYESIYLYIYKQNRELIPSLRKSHKKRLKRSLTKRPRKVIIQNKVDIDQRPDAAKNRTESGHWESDTMVSRQSKPVLQVLVDRFSRYTIIAKQSDKSAAITEKTIINNLYPFTSSCLKTITYDNGTENANHSEINYELRIKSYFCKPYHSWEKGTVENTIGLIRQYLPKKTDIGKVDEAKIISIGQKLNDRPRKCLGFKTPAEIFNCIALKS